MANRGASYHQDPFIKNKQRKLYASRSWPEEFSVKVNMSRVSLDAFRPWIETRVCQLLGKEDEIVSEYCIAQLEAFDPIEGHIDPREVQVNLEGFLGEPQAQVFMEELWKLLISAQSDPGGVAMELIEQQRREDEERRRIAELERVESEKKRVLEREKQEAAVLKREQQKREERRRERSRSRSMSERRGRRRRSRSRSHRYRR